MSESDIYKVYSIPDKNKIRLGKDYDGGYVIYDLNNYDKLIGCGVSDDISFEEDFIKKYNTDCTVYDGTINKLPKNNENIKFIKKNISYINSYNTTNLEDEFNKYNNIFLKMDIEGHEVNWILNQSLENLNKIKQCVIEFHNEDATGYVDNSGRWRYVKVFTNINKSRAIAKLTATHTICHFHGNNGGGGKQKFTKINNVLVPNTCEITFIRKSESTIFLPNKEPLPCSLDMPNGKNMPDINLNYYPFVL